MIKKEEFTELISKYQDNQKRIDKLENVMGVFLGDSPIINFYWELFEKVLKLRFSEMGADLIDWWLFERNDSESQMWDKDNKLIPVNTIEDLWNIVESYRI